MRTRLLVGTRKGAWIYTANESRRCWEVSEPIMPGWTVHHMAADLRCDPPRLYAAANHWAWGPSVA
ncbi:MAG: exo-alpha-sialidase, partial [Chloroflexi bacterium CFX7]|nr:exo-alpha-sialidase [Chloroflexi bacterium CFX7]